MGWIWRSIKISSIWPKQWRSYAGVQKLPERWKRVIDYEGRNKFMQNQNAQPNTHFFIIVFECLFSVKTGWISLYNSIYTQVDSDDRENLASTLKYFVKPLFGLFLKAKKVCTLQCISQFPILSITEYSMKLILACSFLPYSGFWSNLSRLYKKGRKIDHKMFLARKYQNRMFLTKLSFN